MQPAIQLNMPCPPNPQWETRRLKTLVAEYKRQIKDLVNRNASLEQELFKAWHCSGSSAWVTTLPQDNDSHSQAVDSTPPSPSHHHRREEEHSATQLQDQRILVDLTTEDTGFRCSNCRKIFNSSAKCFALSGCRCVSCVPLA